MTEDRDEVAKLCQELAELEVVAAQRGQARQLEALLADVRAGCEVGDRRTELLRRCGIPAGPRRDVGVRLRVPGDGRPSSERYQCPVDRCSRSWLRPPGDPIPLCQLFTVPLDLAPGLR
jgi:hypothetical protein